MTSRISLISKMAHLPACIVVNIIEYLPWKAQLAICSASRQSVYPKLEESSNIIKRSAIIQRNRIMSFVESDHCYEHDTMYQAAFILYRHLGDQAIRRELKSIVRKQSSNNQSFEVLMTIAIGTRLGWAPKKTYSRILRECPASQLYRMGW